MLKNITEGLKVRVAAADDRMPKLESGDVRLEWL
jgi:hypothetical protein